MKNICDEDYFEIKQTDINERMRAILIDWLIGVIFKFHMREQTLYMTVNIIDRFLCKCPLKKDNLQLLGITALFIAGKYEEIYPPDLKNYIKLCDSHITEDDIFNLEDSILLALNFNLVFHSSLWFYECYVNQLKIDETCIEAYYFGLQFLNLMMLEFSTLKY